MCVEMKIENLSLLQRLLRNKITIANQGLVKLVQLVKVSLTVTRNNEFVQFSKGFE